MHCNCLCSSLSPIILLTQLVPVSGSSVWCQDTAPVAPPQEDAAVVPATAAPATVSNNSEPPALSPVIPAAEPGTPSAVPAVPATAPVIPDTVPVAPGTVPVVPDTKSAIPDAEPAVPDVPVTDAPADTTTAAPNTTTSTTTTTTTTAAPPPPAPTRGIWSVLDETSTRVCVLAQMATQMKIPYLTSTNKVGSSCVQLFFVPISFTGNFLFVLYNFHFLGTSGLPVMKDLQFVLLNVIWSD